MVHRLTRGAKKGRQFKNELLSLFFVYLCCGICRKLLFNKECLFRLADGDASLFVAGSFIFPQNNVHI